MLKPLMSLRDRGEFYHRLLARAKRRNLNDRGIPDALIDRYTLGWNGKAITIPIENRDGDVVFLKFATPTFDGPSPKMETPPGVPLELFGWRSLLRQPGRIVIAANEFDCMALEARGFLAVCSTGGPGTFDADWVKHFDGIDRIYVCFNRDAASERAAEKVASLLSRATVVHLPETVGAGGGVSDYFVTLGNSPDNFERVLAAADLRESLDIAAWAPPPAHLQKHGEELKKAVPIAKVIGDYTRLRISGKQLVGWCPWHEAGKPTLRVDPKTNTFRCAVCGKSGDTIKFLRLQESLTFAQALEQLQKIRYEDNYNDAA